MAQAPAAKCSKSTNAPYLQKQSNTKLCMTKSCNLLTVKSQIAQIKSCLSLQLISKKIQPKDKEKGGASRFFYCPKTSKKDRNDGCDELESKSRGHGNAVKCNICDKWLLSSTNSCNCNPKDRKEVFVTAKNNHPTVKPTELMAYLIRMVTPKGGTVLDPFMGSGSTGKAAVREGMKFIGIEREDEYMEISRRRIEHEQSKNKHREFFN